MTQKPNQDETVLSRWSRRKHQQQQIQDESSLDKAVPEPEKTIEETTEEKIESSKEALPIWQQDEADPEQKKSALAALFRQPEFNDVDRLNEYDEDFTQFSSLGNIIPGEMKRMIKIVEERTRPDENSKPQQKADNKDDLSA